MKGIARRLAICSIPIFAPALSAYAGVGWFYTAIPPSPANCPQCQETPIAVGPYPCKGGAGCCLEWWGSAEYRYKQKCGAPGLPACVIIGPGYAYPGTLITSGPDAYCWSVPHEPIPAVRWSFFWYPVDGGGEVVYVKGGYKKCEKVRLSYQAAADGTAGNDCFASGNTE